MENLMKINHDGLLNNNLISFGGYNFAHDFKKFKDYQPYFITFIETEIEHTDLDGYAEVETLGNMKCAYPDLWVKLGEEEDYGFVVYNDYVLAEITKTERWTGENKNLIYLYTDYMETPYWETGDLIYNIMCMFKYVGMTDDCIIFEY